ncbi:FKBP-type peptidyl-prolyl cis-trans isomerase [Aliifodinibius sp. S!AR15-10]|uniref:FKBP-type peptidyl-prolyl cis-trans isomerase n=1 Tax=Aliifodinibius sp. S!AR15-10 TaxID=2950437 RepID=UPI002862EBBD|nr:FKBP-type peptidyl-prolyl cis-trans isomerase [Aliifodinibius sp. S!AR15-10]MDR8391588.1 FKBP-type peptidyl-prolyl cis-trans isomerase [Aliifodinibius sp. S!AR15-10]
MLVFLTGIFTLFVSCNSGSSSFESGNANLESNIDSVSYSLGYQNGMVLSQQNMTDIKIDKLVAGIRAGLNDSTESPIAEAEMRSIIQSYQMQKQQETMKQQQAEAQEYRKKGEEFLAQNTENEGVQETESGLQYQVLEEGSGASPKASDTVTVHYRGTLLDGTEFDSSIGGDPATFPLNRVIEGWTEGVQLMSEGAKYKFWIPADLAYGNNPRPGGPIKPGQTLVFEVELLEVN